MSGCDRTSWDAMPLVISAQALLEWVATRCGHFWRKTTLATIDTFTARQFEYIVGHPEQKIWGEVLPKWRANMEQYKGQFPEVATTH